ncbi:MAG: hypothetical protein LBT92_02385 [Rickettsiales bacterium]|nr:hypothetical protein [Rickettsiales bacterium]
MNFIRRHIVSLSVLFGTLGLFLLTLYFIPSIVKITDQNKDRVTGIVERAFGLDIRVNGEVSYAILPTPSIIVNEIEIMDKDAVIASARRMYAEIKIMELVSGNLTVESIILGDGSLDLAAVTASGSSELKNFFRGNMFKSLVLRNFSCEYKGETFDRINLFVHGLPNQGVSLAGALRYMNGSINDLVGYVTWDDQDNLAAGAKFGYSSKRDSISADLTYSDKDEIKTVGGTLRLSTTSLSKFIQTINKDWVLPRQQVFSSRLEVGASIKTTENAIVFSDGTISSEETVGTWSATLPFDLDDDGSIVLIPSATTIKADFQTIRLAKFITMPKADIIKEIESLFKTGDNPKIFDLFESATVGLTAGNMILPKRTLTGFALNTSPLREADRKRHSAERGILVERMTYRDNKTGMDASGVVIDRGDTVGIVADIRSAPMFGFANPMFKNINVSNLKGSMVLDGDRFSLKDYSFGIYSSVFSGKSIEREGDRVVFDVESPMVDLGRFASEDIDLALVLSKLSSVRGGDVSMGARVGELRLDERTVYSDFVMDAVYKGDDLEIRRMDFSEGQSLNRISGNLSNITGESGEFENFRYTVSSKSKQRVAIPIVKNNFIDRIIKNGVTSVNIQMDGAADNPNSNISAEAGDVKIRVDGKLQDSSSKYRIDFTHGELKGFLFSNGYLGAEMLDYIYDAIPFRITADVEKGRLNNLVVEAKGNRFVGSADQNGAKLGIARFDIRQIFKKMKDDEAYINMILKFIRSSRYSLRISSPAAMNYDGDRYDDLEFDLSVARNPGAFKFSFRKGGMTAKVDVEVANGHVFDGALSVSDYKIPPDMMKNSLMDLRSGSMRGAMKFSTEGLNLNQVLGSLGGDFDIVVEDGEIGGISGQQGQLGNILDLANITTNNIMYVFENSFKSGRLPFSRLSLKGKMRSANVEDAAVELVSRGMSAAGALAFNVISRAIGVKALFTIEGLSPGAIGVKYSAEGFINNLESKVDPSEAVGRINIPYLQKKKRERAAAEATEAAAQ